MYKIWIFFKNKKLVMLAECSNYDQAVKTMLEAKEKMLFDGANIEFKIEKEGDE